MKPNSIFLPALLAFAVVVSISQTASAAPMPAFQGAEGFGANALGGRGGKVYYVTNLNDSGPGSLRAACDAEGPRTVLFAVSGNIELKTPVRIARPFITIAGQTAPGDGICLKNHPLLIFAHDVVVRYLRCRPGDVAGKEMDALSIGTGSHDVVVDHCSATWGSDENLSVSGKDIGNITVQWCFISEALNHSVHHKGDHGYGSLIRTDGPVTYHHNIYAHNKSRNPRPGSYGDPRNTLLDFRNNLIYDWSERAGYSAEDPTSINYVGNYLKPGPSTRRLDEAFHIGGLATKLYVSGTVYAGPKGMITDDWKLVSSAMPENKITQPFPSAYVTTQAAPAAYEMLLRGCGATLPARDAVDQRLVREITEGKGRIIDSQKDVGAWPELKSSPAPLDTDGDGIPDEWERKHKLDPKNPADGNATEGNAGYTNQEIYLDSLVLPASLAR